MRSGHRRAIGGGRVIHRHGAHRAIGPRHEDGCRGVGFGGREGGGGEGDGAGAELVVHDRQRAQGAADDGGRGRIGQPQQHRLVAADGEIILHGDGERRGRLPVGEGEPTAREGVVRRGHRRVVRREEVHRHRAVGAAGANHGDGGAGAVLVEAVGERAEAEDGIVVQNSQHGAGTRAEGPPVGWI